jgi:diaminopropionate ammonia-lyase
VRWFINTHASRGAYTPREQQVVSREAAGAALREFGQWPGYERTPLRSLEALARTLGLAAVLYKDESGRFGLGSFKALGGAYAAGRALARHARSVSSLRSEAGARQTLCCATDGNHGIAVAFAAQRLGCRCVVLMHEHAPEGKASTIRALGAEVIRTPGTYDDSVALARRLAGENDWVAVLDTSEEEFDETVVDVMTGYATIALEVLEQTRAAPPTHIFAQAGVGGLAAAIAGIFAETLRSDRPIFVTVEPETAACVLESAIRGERVQLTGELRTKMEMLSCGSVSKSAWTILSQRSDAFLAIDDAAALAAQGRLRAFGIDVGISGAASFGGLLGALSDGEFSRLIKLTRQARVLVFGTESGGAPAVNAVSVPVPMP